jgi:16S rRNA (adenine1518-N6/adenine1519-N6)-dimethyltransferase
VLVQAAATRTGSHAVSRKVFLPPPRVDSAIVAFRRKRDDDQLIAIESLPSFSKFVRASFKHRRKTLGNNLGAANFERATVDEAIAQVGLKPTVRPQELPPAKFVELWSALA